MHSLSASKRSEFLTAGGDVKIASDVIRYGAVSTVFVYTVLYRKETATDQGAARRPKMPDAILPTCLSGEVGILLIIFLQSGTPLSGALVALRFLQQTSWKQTESVVTTSTLALLVAFKCSQGRPEVSHPAKGFTVLQDPAPPCLCTTFAKLNGGMRLASCEAWK